MKKLKTRYKVLLGIVIIILAIVVLINWDEINLRKYKYMPGVYSLSGTIDIDGITFQEINEDEYIEIYQEMNRQDIMPFENEVIGRIDYIYADEIWKYKIFGSRIIKDRILLKGEENYIFSSNYPELYFCRQDVLNSIIDRSKE